LTYAEKRGYEYDQEEVSSEVSFNTKRPSLGKNVKISISLYKNGKLQKKLYKLL
jgi:hypothetical protein